MSFNLIPHLYLQLQSKIVMIIIIIMIKPLCTLIWSGIAILESPSLALIEKTLGRWHTVRHSMRASTVENVAGCFSYGVSLTWEMRLFHKASVGQDCCNLSPWESRPWASSPRTCWWPDNNRRRYFGDNTTNTSTCKCFMLYTWARFACNNNAIIIIMSSITGSNSSSS